MDLSSNCKISVNISVITLNNIVIVKFQYFNETFRDF